MKLTHEFTALIAVALLAKDTIALPIAALREELALAQRGFTTGNGVVTDGLLGASKSAADAFATSSSSLADSKQFEDSLLPVKKRRREDEVYLRNIEASGVRNINSKRPYVISIHHNGATRVFQAQPRLLTNHVSGFGTLRDHRVTLGTSPNDPIILDPESPDPIISRPTTSPKLIDFFSPNPQPGSQSRPARAPKLHNFFPTSK